MLTAFKALSSLALATLAVARTGPLGTENNYEAPPGVQIGTLSGPITCNVTVLGLITIPNIKVNIKVGGAVTGTVARNQDFYLTGRAVVTIPVGFSVLLAGIGVKSISGTAGPIYISLPGSKAGQYDIASFVQINVPTTPIVSNQSIVVTVPPTGSPPFDIGPIPPDATSHDVNIGVGEARVNITANWLGFLPIPAKIVCPANKPIDYLASVTIGGDGTNTVRKVSGDYPPVLDLPDPFIIGTVGINYVCNIDGVGNLTIPVSLTAAGDILHVKPNTQFSLINNHGTVYISPTTLAAALKSTALPAGAQASAFQIKLDTLTMSGVNAFPATQNVFATPALSDKYTINAGGANTYKVDIPGNNGQLPFINLTSAATPGILQMYLGEAGGSINVFGGGGSQIGSLGFHCPALFPEIPINPFTIVP